MTARVSRRPPGRSVRDALLILCAGWLVTQNALLLDLGMWHRPVPGWSAYLSMLRALFEAIFPFWVIACAALLGWAFVAGMAPGPHAQPRERRVEGSHERIR